MIGYHFTTSKNYREIKKEGLKPYPLFPKVTNRPEEYLHIFRGVTEGIYIWANKQKDFDERINIAYQSWKIGTKQVVLLKVEVDEKDILKERGDTILTIFHNWSSSHLKKNHPQPTNQEAYIITKTVDPKNITVVKRFKPIIELYPEMEYQI